MSFLRGFFVQDADIEILEERLDDSNHPGNGLPDPGQDYYTFAGEVPWSIRFAHDIRTNAGGLRKIKEEAFADTISVTKKRRLKKAWVYLYNKLGQVPSISPVIRYSSDSDKNGVEINWDELETAIAMANSRVEEKDRLTAEDLIQQKPTADEIRNGYHMVNEWNRIPGIPVETTSWYYSWESYHSRVNTFSGFRFPSPQICEAFGLVGSYRSIELNDQHGRQATVYRESRGDNGDGTKFDFLYLRKDLLNRYLERSNRSLVWIIWGERRFHYDIYESIMRKPEVSAALQAYEHVHKRLVRYSRGR